MTPLVPELSALPVTGTFDGELVAFGWQTPETFDDGQALFEAVCAHELEGIVTKRRNSRNRPHERGWVKIKNRNYWRYELERESALNKPCVKQFV